MYLLQLFVNILSIFKFFDLKLVYVFKPDGQLEILLSRLGFMFLGTINSGPVFLQMGDLDTLAEIGWHG